MLNDLTRWTKEGLIKKVKRLESEVTEWQNKYYELKLLLESKKEGVDNEN